MLRYEAYYSLPTCNKYFKSCMNIICMKKYLNYLVVLITIFKGFSLAVSDKVTKVTTKTRNGPPNNKNDY